MNPKRISQIQILPLGGVRQIHQVHYRRHMQADQ